MAYFLTPEPVSLIPIMVNQKIQINRLTILRNNNNTFSFGIQGSWRETTTTFFLSTSELQGTFPWVLGANVFSSGSIPKLHLSIQNMYDTPKVSDLLSLGQRNNMQSGFVDSPFFITHRWYIWYLKKHITFLILWLKKSPLLTPFPLTPSNHRWPCHWHFLGVHSTELHTGLFLECLDWSRGLCWRPPIAKIATPKELTKPCRPC